MVLFCFGVKAKKLITFLAIQDLQGSGEEDQAFRRGYGRSAEADQQVTGGSSDHQGLGERYGGPCQVIIKEGQGSNGEVGRLGGMTCEGRRASPQMAGMGNKD